MVRPGGDDRRQLPVAEVKPDSWGNRAAESPPKDEVVTLTKTQLRAILEAIGQVGALNINDQLNQPNEPGENDTLQKNGTNPQSDFGMPSEAHENGRSCSPTNQDSSSQATCPLDVLVPSTSNKLCPSLQAEMSPEKLSVLSKLDQKRMQWQKEKAEMHDWNPWGKPGAGAPTRRSQLVAPVAPRMDNQLLMVHTSNTLPYNGSVPHSLPSCLTSPNHCRPAPCTELGSNEFPTNKIVANYNTATQHIKPVPPVFKSSIAFGGDNDSRSEEAFKKQHWIRELEYQRDEQRFRRLADPDQVRLNQFPGLEWMNGNREDIETISVSFDGCGAPCGAEIEDAARTHIRGQGFKLDPVSAAMADERRQKAQEYQQAIRLQMEEKQRRLREEREKKKREEEEEERRLAAERAQMQAEYEQEQKRLKQKIESEEKKHQAMVSAVQEAQALAEAARKTRKVHKLLPISDSVQISNSPRSPSKSVIEDTEPNAQTKDEEPVCQLSGTEEGTKQPQQTATVRPVQCTNEDIQQKDSSSGSPTTPSSPSKELGVQTITSQNFNVEEYSGYTVNRVLTPSPFRIKTRKGHARDFGTQTDVNYGKWIGDDAESTESNTSSVWGPVGKRLIRVQHSKPYKASRRNFGSEMDLATERPKWGVNQPSKTYVRMTDRDPHYTKRKKLQELRKQHWEREMAAQQAIRNARRTTMSSYPSLRSRRLMSSSEGTVGFSSSEFETRSYSQVRSNSPPRRRRASGFHSVCGSAEELAYLGHTSSNYTTSLLPSMLRRRGSQSSDNLPSIIGGSEPSPSRIHNHFSFPEMPMCSGSLPPMRRKWHSQEAFYPHKSMPHLREQSPPIPAIQRRMITEKALKILPPTQAPSRRKWSDQESFDLESVALSHANKSQQDSSDDGSDQNERESVSSADSERRTKTPAIHNPLVNPEVVTGRPTPRQDRILQNLSSLRQGLLQKQRELESLIRKPPEYTS